MFSYHFFIINNIAVFKIFYNIKYAILEEKKDLT